MNWNYRIIENDLNPAGSTFGVHEVYYDESGAVETFTDEPVGVSGDSVEDILGILSMMLADCQAQPVLKLSEILKAKS